MEEKIEVKTLNGHPLADTAARKELENKQPAGNYLTEHQKLKTINGQSLVGEGNINVVGVGTNGDTTLQKLESIVEKIREIGAMPIVNCVSQTEDGKTTGDEQTIADVNKMIKRLYVPGARFDIATGTGNNPEAPAPANVLQDAVHPNATGHMLMAERFKFDLNCLKNI